MSTGGHKLVWEICASFCGEKYIDLEFFVKMSDNCRILLMNKITSEMFISENIGTNIFLHVSSHLLI